MTTVSPSARNGAAELDQAALACPASGPEIVPQANRSPGRTVAPLTVACASCCGNVQYRPRALPRVTASPLSSPRARCRAPSRSLGAQVGQRLRVLRARRARGSGSSAASGTIQGEIEVANDFAEERAERLVLPALDVARAPVVDEHEAEDVLARPRRSRSGRRARLPGAGHEAELELDVELARSGRTRPGPQLRRGAGRAGGRSACPRRRPSPRGRGSRSAGGASSAAAGRRRGGTGGRRSSRARARSRSRRSRRSRPAAAPRPRPAGRAHARRRHGRAGRRAAPAGARAAPPTPPARRPSAR